MSDSTNPPSHPRFRIVDESADWIVVDKPPRQLVHPSKPGHSGTLWHQLRALLAFEIACGGQVSIINRLDRETSGLTLIAKTRETASRLSIQMERRRISKQYLAIVLGWPEADEWTVKAPILRQGEREPSLVYLRQMVHPDGALCKTSFRVEQRFEKDGERFALVRAWPETGRMHQIRLHLAHSGYPIIGDKLYMGDGSHYLEFIETGWTDSLARELRFPRHALHSTYLELADTGEHWEATLPEDMERFLC